MSAPTRSPRFFTLAEANARLPLVAVIVRDIVELAGVRRARQIALIKADPDWDSELSPEVESLQDEIEDLNERMRTLIEELAEVGAEIKDFDMGLVDFPGWRNGREVCLCWKLGEPEIGYWHETDAGFAGRRRIKPGEFAGRPGGADA